ncbi:diguanylate cyclase [Clostridium sp.]|jgi:diguanylate cyclase|uniref:diguanylate cyclase n=1 Tax=Clostridium sp. TaxID=1506 RepID=UPI00258CC5D6|nr:diguanylate cyclase [Clostridium sp.]MDF2505292.1 diguanylate cyclase [Clostridium sp.]
MLRDLFANASILVAFISVSQQLFKDKSLSHKSPISFKIATGFMSGLLGIILMIYSLHIDNNTIVDFRNIPIILTAMYGGLIPSVISSLLIGIFRISYFGLNQSSISAVICALLMGIGCGLISHIRISKKHIFIYSVAYSLIVSTIFFSIIVKNNTTLIDIIFLYSIAMILISAAIYKYTVYLSDLTNMYKQLKEGYSKDFLTGLNNVRCFDTVFNKMLVDVKEKNKRLSILFIDIDFFKKVNDNYGHSNGDIILKQLSSVLIDSCRSFDIVSRNGGEEFSVLLLDCYSDHAIKIAEKIRRAVEIYPFVLNDGTKINITISIGVSTYPDITSDLDKLFEEADSALYIAKRTGRNKVVLAEPNKNKS